LGLLGQAGPIIVGGGSGESEYSMMFAFKNLKELSKECLQLTCGLSDQEKTVFKNFNAAANLSYNLVFKNQEAMAEKIYQVNQAAGEVLINQNRLWLDQNNSVSYQVSDAFALWVEILSADLKWNENQLHSIQEKIKSTYRNKIERVTINFEPKATFELLIWKRDGFDQFFVKDPSFKNVELSQFIQTEFRCDAKEQALNIYSPTWVSASPIDEADLLRKVFFQMSFGYKTSCDQKTSFGTGRILFMAKLNADLIYEIDSKTIAINLKN
jgi:hypothetical protein